MRITSPDDGAVAPYGTGLRLEAEFFLSGERQMAPTGPVEWRVGSPVGKIIARGPVAEATLDPGTHDIFVVYGTAVDSVRVTVLAPTPTTPPMGSVSGRLFKDNTGGINGVYDPGIDTPLTNAYVIAVEGTCPGGTVVELDWTDSTGSYSIGGLPVPSTNLYISFTFLRFPIHTTTPPACLVRNSSRSSLASFSGLNKRDLETIFIFTPRCSANGCAVCKFRLRLGQ